MTTVNNLILNDPAVSFWLKNAYKHSLEKRDILDAWKDARLLTKMLEDELPK